MPQLSIDEAFAAALEHHRAGRLGEAEQGYRAILARAPEHADSLNLLGVIALQVGDLPSALALEAVAFVGFTAAVFAGALWALHHQE